MFEYNARTETINGARFIEKDVILFDYQYSGDILLRADVNLKSSGFGFVIAEDEGEAISRSANIYLLKLNSNDSYQVIYKSGTEQETILNQHVGSATRVYGDENVILFFRKQEERLIITKAIPLSDVSEVRFEEIELLQYVMPHDMENFKIGIYSNGGNTVRYAAVSTEAPSNWITNVRSANGGRIRWIKNGFIIEEAEYDIEAEAENIQLEAGTYYFDYKTDNPDMKAYVFESYLHNTGVKRSTKEIVDTSVDEEKNILREDGSFLLTEDHAVNIRFKAKWGKVTEICVKTIKQSGFVETDYNTTVRPPSRLVFDLRKIKKIRLTGTVNSAPDYNLENYYLVQRGTREIRLNTEIRPGEENTFEFIADTSELFLNGEPYRTLLSADNILSMFYNVDADIRELTVTTASGEEVNIILQRTFKVIVDGSITSPILVTDSKQEPLDLSAAYRLAVRTERQCELFYAWNPVTLSKPVNIIEPDIKIWGIKRDVTVNKKAKSADETADEKTRIQYTPDAQDLLTGGLHIASDAKSPYKWICVEYNGITGTKCVFTNWEREIFDLEEDVRVYLAKTPIDATGNIMVYGIKNADYLNKDYLYYVPTETTETLIDLAAYRYDNIGHEKYHVTGMGKVVLDDEVLNTYRYIVIDYLKDNSYALNHKGDYWEIDVSSDDRDYTVLYDAEDGIIQNTYRSITMDELKDGQDVEENDFVVLEASS